MRKVDQIIEQEKERVERYLKESSFDRFIAVVQDELLVKNMEALLNKNTGLNYMLSNHFVSEMFLLYRLYSPLKDCLREIAQRFKIFISLKGNEIIDSLEQSMQEFDSNSIMNKITESPFVEDLITFCEKQDFQRYNKSNMSQEAFKDIYFVTAFQSAFASFLNRSVKDHTVAEMLGRSTEKILKKGNQTHSDVKINYFIENITNLFSYMEDKDLFIEVYQAGLARRLLENKIASIDYEKELIGRIKMC